MTAPTVALDAVRHHHRGGRGTGPPPAVDVPRLVLGPGTTAVLGRNGSGKSTLLRLLATAERVQTGTVTIGGLDTADEAARVLVRRRLGYLGQADGLPPRMPVVDFLDYVGVLKELAEADRRRWAWWALSRLELVDVADRRIRTLSGGVRRRVALAQALLGGPELLVLDEPEISLDLEQRHRLAALLAEQGERATVVVATHQPDLAAGFDHVVVLDRGVVRFTGPPARLAALGDGRFEEGYLAVLRAG